MTWFRVDDGFSDHPKVHELQQSKHWKGAVALWTLAGSWCAKHEKDGIVPTHTVRRLGGTKHESDALVACGLWIRVVGGFVFHQWEERNPTHADLESKREQTKNRVAEWRSKRSGNAVTHEHAPNSVTPPPTLPIPTLPIPSQLREENPAPASPPVVAKAKREPNPAFDAVASVIAEEYGKAYPDACPPKPPGAIVGKLLKASGGDSERVRRALQAYLGDPFWAAKGAGLPTFVGKFDEFERAASGPRLVAGNGKPGRVTRARATTAADFEDEPEIAEAMKGW